MRRQARAGAQQSCALQGRGIVCVDRICNGEARKGLATVSQGADGGVEQRQSKVATSNGDVWQSIEQLRLSLAKTNTAGAMTKISTAKAEHRRSIDKSSRGGGESR